MPLRLAASALLLVATTACTAVIEPPAAPAEPQSVFVLDHGRHSSLVLPGDGGGLVRYSYGDWDWYALEKTGLFRGSSAVLWPTRAGFGRRELAGTATASSVRVAVRVGVEHLYEVVVDAREAAALRRRLDALFHAADSTLVYNEAYDLEFVHHPEKYWAFRNSNQMVARWLERLGCRVRGPALFSRWRVEASPSR
ncbi:MAG: hypothetical protein ACREKI_01715 [Gemmatimonadota bacterium]